MKKLPQLAFLLLLPLCATAAETREKYDELIANQQQLDDDARLQKLFAIDWARGLRESPEFATAIGVPGEDDRWTDQSEAAIAQRKREQQWPLAVVKSLDRAKLSAADQLNYDLFRRDLEHGLEGNQFPGELLAISQLGGVQQNVAQTFTQMPTSSVKGYENILARLRATPALIDQNMALLERGLAQKIVPPKITLRDVPQQVLDLLPDDPLQSALLQSFTKFPQNISAEDQTRLRAEAGQIYREQVAPAYRKLHDFLTEKYWPAARDSVAWSALPNGAAWYAYDVRESTTTTMSPQEIHELGLREVKRIRGEMNAVIAETKFQGTFDEFTKYLRTDPKFSYRLESELLAGYRDIAHRIDPELPRFFGKLPRLTYGVKPIPAYAQKSAPAAYYESGSQRGARPGWFLANTFNLPSRLKWQMECLTLHEAVPGHHLQISLAQEMQNVPEFRKYSGYTAYVEGWALYCESLGGELGLYKDPYSHFGELTFEMWRACRLVVDTGLHQFGWSREKALAYLMENTGKDEHEATVEIDRYIVWPGQADAYKIGQLKIRELRADATRELGDAFDIRSFHDALLANGALPLDVLEATMKEWIRAQKAEVKPSKS